MEKRSFLLDESTRGSPDAGSTCQVALLTPPGRGAIATLVLEGPAATGLLGRCFVARGGRKVAQLPMRRIIFGNWIDPGARSESQGEVPSDVGEEVVVCRYTPNRYEVHCHGGQAAWQRILRSLTSQGATIQDPEDWLTCQAADAIQAAAARALTETRTARTAAILLDQYQGALWRTIAELAQEIDSAEAAATGPLILEKLERLVELSSAGLHATQPWRVVLTGLPNVGKSQLANALLGFERCVVLDQPGTTRDVVATLTALDGWPVELYDTAGLRATEEEIEAAGVARARTQLDQADLILLVIDSHDPGWNTELENVARRSNVLLVWNKADLLPATETHCERLLISARTGLGIDQLLSTIVCRLLPVPPEPGEAVPFTAEQVTMLGTAYKWLKNGDHSRAADSLRSLLRSSPTTLGTTDSDGT
jgi:tRNA modification GTPase